MPDQTWADLLREVGIEQSRPRPRPPSMRGSAFADRFTTRPPAIDPNSMQSVAGQVAPRVRREDHLRPLPTRQEQEREYARLQQSPREAPAYQAPMNQFADAGNQGLEMTGLPSVRRSAAAFADNRPREGIEEGAMGALSLATLGVGGRSAMQPRSARPAPRTAPMRPPPRTPSPLADEWDGPFYHGTTRDFEAFDPNASSHADHIGTYVSPRPELASEYAMGRRGALAEGGNVRPLQIRRGDYITPGELRQRVDQYIQENNITLSPGADELPQIRATVMRQLEGEGYLGVRDNPLDEAQIFNPARDTRPPFQAPRPGALRHPVRNPMQPEMPPIEARPDPDAGSRGAGPSFDREVSEAARRTPIRPDLGANDRGALHRGGAALRGDEFVDSAAGQGTMRPPQNAQEAIDRAMSPLPTRGAGVADSYSRSLQQYMQRGDWEGYSRTVGIAAEAGPLALVRTARALAEADPRYASRALDFESVNDLARSQDFLEFVRRANDPWFARQAEMAQRAARRDPNAPSRGPSREVLDVPVSSGQTTEVIRNPSRADLARLSVLPRELAADPNIRANAAGQLRYIVDAQGDVFVFRGWDAIHDDVARGMDRMGRRPSGYQADDGSRSDFGRFGYLRREGDRFVSGNGEPLPPSVERLINPRGPSQ
jgi:hypothetical protein